MALAVAVSVGLAALAFMVILLVGLVRHLKVLATSLRTFQEEVNPVLEEIQRMSASAQRRMQGLMEEPGGRLRR